MFALRNQQYIFLLLALLYTSILVKIHLVSNLKLHTAFTPYCSIQKYMDQ